MAEKIKILIVDDMLSIRMLLNKIFSETRDMEVVGMASTPLEAREILKDKQVDVITLDVEMPEMDGITFLGKIMKLRPTPVLMISTLTHAGTQTAVKALELGAVDIIGKPSQKASEIEPYKVEILEKVRAASCANVGQKQSVRPAPSQAALNSLNVEPTKLVDEVFPKRKNTSSNGSKPIVVIGSSTGGPTMLRKILPELTSHCPPIAIAQHMSAKFTKALAEGLNQSCQISVEVVQDNTIAKPGHAYLADGDKHLAIRKSSSGDYIFELLSLDKVNRHRPSVDVLFRSTAQQAGAAATGVLLTGMGDDGARCLKEMKDAGARTLVQNESTSIVYGMPRAAMKIDAGHQELSIDNITNTLKEIKI